MNNARLWLGALLFMQLALASVLFLGDRWRAEDPVPAALVDGEDTQVDRIIISDADGQATLVRDAGEWTLPGLKSLPAQSKKVWDALTRLASLQTLWPVTATAASHERFEVTQEKFQRRVQLFQGERGLADFYLGTSPGFRQVHLRRSAEREVYAVDLNVHDLPARDDQWLDRSLLAVSAPLSIGTADYTLRDSETEGWQLEVHGQDGVVNPVELDPDKARRLVDALASFQVQSLAEEVVSLDELGGELRSLRVETAEDSMTFLFKAAGEQHYVRRDDRDAVFSLSQYDYDSIARIGLEDLILNSPAEPEA